MVLSPSLWSFFSAAQYPQSPFARDFRQSLRALIPSVLLLLLLTLASFSSVTSMVRWHYSAMTYDRPAELLIRFSGENQWITRGTASIPSSATLSFPPLEGKKVPVLAILFKSLKSLLNNSGSRDSRFSDKILTSSSSSFRIELTCPEAASAKKSPRNRAEVEEVSGKKGH